MYTPIIRINTPQAIVAAFHRDATRALQVAELRERLSALGTEPAVSTPEHFGAMLRSESSKWARVVKRAGIYQSQHAQRG